MKYLYFPLIVVILFTLISSLVPAFATSGSAFFMKTNSIGKIYATFNTQGRWMANATISPYPSTSYSIVDPKIISIVRIINSTGDQTTLPVTYTIATSDNSKGTYLINLGPCGDMYLLFVGFDESEINPNNIPDFHDRAYSCPMNMAVGTDLTLQGYSGITFKTPNSTVPEFPFVLFILVTGIVLTIFLTKPRKLVR